ncbi:hypothetical protein HAX54_045505 [Datura stramonium]|uniref:Uncharacterized protein n=1 Tax=Datura stramonium TaxID=4076 RepID=A0ABS8WFU5_DATST|nr:hypothetical protein [Datura stramonium]
MGRTSRGKEWCSRLKMDGDFLVESLRSVLWGSRAINFFFSELDLMTLTEGQRSLGSGRNWTAERLITVSPEPDSGKLVAELRSVNSFFTIDLTNGIELCRTDF